MAVLPKKHLSYTEMVERLHQSKREHQVTSLVKAAEELLEAARRAEQQFDALAAESVRKQGVIDQHELCHDQHGKVNAEHFADACATEQRRIYGCAPHADKLRELEDLRTFYIAEKDRAVEAHVRCYRMLERVRAAARVVLGRFTQAKHFASSWGYPDAEWVSREHLRGLFEALLDTGPRVVEIKDFNGLEHMRGVFGEDGEP